MSGAKSLFQLQAQRVMSGAARIVIRVIRSVIRSGNSLDGVTVDGNAHASIPIIQVAEVAMAIEVIILTTQPPTFATFTPKKRSRTALTEHKIAIKLSM